MHKKTQTWIVTKLKNWNWYNSKKSISDNSRLNLWKIQKIKLWQNSKTQNVTAQKLQLWQNLNSNSNKTYLKLREEENAETQIVTKIKTHIVTKLK